MIMDSSRRGILRKGGVALLGLSAGGVTTYNAAPAFAATLGQWSADDVTIETDDGTISDVYVRETDSSFEISWDNFDASQQVAFMIDARLPNETDASSSYEQVALGEFTLTSKSGSTTQADITWDTQPFPFSFIDNHSGITTSHFENADDGTTTSTLVELTISFDYGYDVVSYTASFDVFTRNFSTTIIDSLEDGDISEYSATSSTAYNVVQSPTYDGSYALNGVENNELLTSHSGLNTYPQAGDTVEWFVRGDNAYTGTAFNLGIPDGASTPSGNGGYQLRIANRDDRLQIGRWNSDGSFTILDTDTSVTIESGKWYKGRFQWGTDGTLILELIDAGTGNVLNSVSATDSTYTSGGCGWGTSPSNGTPDAYFDLARIIS